MYKAINNHIAKRPKKLLISKYSNINGKVLLAVVSKNFAKVPKTIPKTQYKYCIYNFPSNGYFILYTPYLIQNLFIMHL